MGDILYYGFFGLVAAGLIGLLIFMIKQRQDD